MCRNFHLRSGSAFDFDFAGVCHETEQRPRLPVWGGACLETPFNFKVVRRLIQQISDCLRVACLVLNSILNWLGLPFHRSQVAVLKKREQLVRQLSSPVGHPGVTHATVLTYSGAVVAAALSQKGEGQNIGCKPQKNGKTLLYFTNKKGPCIAPKLNGGILCITLGKKGCCLSLDEKGDFALPCCLETRIGLKMKRGFGNQHRSQNERGSTLN